MSKLFLLFWIFWLSVHYSYAGGWECYRYKFAVVLGSGESYTGYNETGHLLEDHRLDPLEYIKAYLNVRDTLVLYDTIYDLRYPEMEGYLLTAVMEKNTRRIPVKHIKQVTILDKSHCQKGIGPDGNYIVPDRNFGWVGHTMLITELTESEIILLQDIPYYTTAITDTKDNDNYSAVEVVSYATGLSKTETDELINQCQDNLKALFREGEYLKLKQRLRKYNIIIIHIAYDP